MRDKAYFRDLLVGCSNVTISKTENYVEVTNYGDAHKKLVRACAYATLSYTDIDRDVEMNITKDEMITVAYVLAGK